MFLGTKPNITEYQDKYIKFAKWRDAQRQAVLPLCDQILPPGEKPRNPPTTAYQDVFNTSAQHLLSGKWKPVDGKKKKLSEKALLKQRARNYTKRPGLESSTTYGDAFVQPPKGFEPPDLCRPKVILVIFVACRTINLS